MLTQCEGPEKYGPRGSSGYIYIYIIWLYRYYQNMDYNRNSLGFIYGGWNPTQLCGDYFIKKWTKDSYLNNLYNGK